MNVGALLRTQALRAPSRIAIRDAASGEGTTLAALDEAACRVAAALLARGVTPGTHVAVAGRSSVALVAGVFGALYAGAVVVPVSLGEAPEPLAARLLRAQCMHALADDAGAALLARCDTALPATRDVLSLAPLFSDTTLPRADGPLALPPGAQALLLATSGTTGTPKGARIAHASLLVHTALLVSDALRLGPDDRVLATLPLAHSYGLRITLLAPLVAGAEIVLARRFDAARTLRALHDFQVTFAPVVPTMLAAWADVPRAPDEDLSALRFVLSAGAPLSDTIALRAEARLGCAVRQGYGMTEATFSAVDAPPAPRVLGSVGRAVLGVELRIVDADGRAVPPGETGELVVRGHHVMLGYDDDAETEAVRLPNGFLRSGDLGHIDADGRVWVTDRRKDLILRGGANVAPSTVERALATAPGVRAVAVFGVPHDYYGEEVVAALHLDAGAKPDADALAAHAAARLAHPEQPRAFVFVDALPANATGKIDRRALREAVLRGALTVVRSAPRRPTQSE
jgi:long-chain acyl-CoA synthetase